jgi:hypothetical protein
MDSDGRRWTRMARDSDGLRWSRWGRPPRARTGPSSSSTAPAGSPPPCPWPPSPAHSRENALSERSAFAAKKVLWQQPKGASSTLVRMASEGEVEGYELWDVWLPGVWLVPLPPSPSLSHISAYDTLYTLRTHTQYVERERERESGEREGEVCGWSSMVEWATLVTVGTRASMGGHSIRVCPTGFTG